MRVCQSNDCWKTPLLVSIEIVLNSAVHFLMDNPVCTLKTGFLLLTKMLPFTLGIIFPTVVVDISNEVT